MTWLMLRSSAHDHIARLKQGRGDLSEALLIAKALREAREFELLDQLTDQMRRAGDKNPTVHRLQAQSLIERGRAISALDVLESSATKIAWDSPEWSEAHGLMGRAWKQLFFDADNKSSAVALEALACSTRGYFIPYNADPVSNVWHGINLLALATYAQSRDLPIEPPLDRERLARKIISTLKALPKDKRDNWYYGSLAEAHLATGDLDAVEANIKLYLQSDSTTAFAIGGTLRQFTDLWQLEKKGERENAIVQALRAALMSKEFGRLELRPEQFQRALVDQPSKQQLESILGPDGPKTFQWFQLGLKRASAVGVVCEGELARIGSGFLVNGSDFRPAWRDELLCLTNSHVVSSDPADGGIAPENALVRFDAVDKNKSYRVAEILWLSPPQKLDAALLRLTEKVEGIEPLKNANRLPLADGKQRVYVVGYPGGGELAISLQDNVLLEHEGPTDGRPLDPEVCHLHYRAPTEKGNSGSPVFNGSWEVVALHHAGGEAMRRLNGKPGEWPANEGLWIKSIMASAARLGQ
jgi:hypothetical protein